ncbi:T9SS type A sorting domain-containing protein [Saprospiraceae bacterium]|nr:T9SS type A sorting domain-containing protein [Saprospiraceae bacterium]
MYPNPAIDELIVEFEIGKLSQLSLEVVNILGQVVYIEKDESIPPGKNRKRIDVSTYEAGAYFVFLETKNGVVQHKIIKN